MRNKFLLILIFCLALGTRLFYLGIIPNGLYSDEAAYGYNAYSILKTGRDEYGVKFPLAFKSFGEYKAPLSIYTLVPFVWLFGLRIESVRLVSVFLGVCTIWMIFRSIQLTHNNRKIALLVAFTLSISPFMLQFNRMGHESNLSVFLLSLGILGFLYHAQKKKPILFAIIPFVLSMYAHHDAKILGPLLMILLLVIFRKRMLLNRTTIIQLFIGLILFLVSAFLLFQKSYLNRPLSVLVYSDPGITAEIVERRNEYNLFNSNLGRIFQNKAVLFPLQTIQNYLTHFNPGYLFFQGDGVKIYSTVGMGILYIVELPFLVLGIRYLFLKKNPYNSLIFLLLLVAPIPAALTRYVPSSSRTLLSVIPFAILIGFGLYSMKNIGGKIRTFLISGVSFLMILNMIYYFQLYYINTPVRYALEWHYGMKDVMDYVKQNQQNYNTVWLSKNAWGYIYPLFYLQYPPEKYQKQAHLSELNEFGFGWVDSFDKYRFDTFPVGYSELKDVLFIGNPSDFSNLKNPLYTVYYPNKAVAFYIADWRSF